MAENSLSKLQNRVNQLEKENLRLRETNQKFSQDNYQLKKKIRQLEDNIDSIIETKVKEITNNLYKQIIIENEQLKEENNKLKRILNNTSDNSGIPTSKTPIGSEKRIPNCREKSDKNKGGQQGHKKHKLEKFRKEEITDTYIHELNNDKCDCGGKFIKIGKREKDEFEIDIRLMKIRHEFGEYECNCCHKKINVPIPNNLKEENQYGNNVQAIAVSLLNEGFVSYHRTKELISGFTGGEMQMSEGYLVKLQKRCYEKLSDFDNELNKQLLKEKVLNWDDTVITINGKQSCLRFYGTEKLAYYKAHLKKNKEGIDNDNILSYLPKECVVVHDHNKVNYNDDYNFTNAECCVHLIRDLKKLNEVLPRTWINQLITLLVTTNEKRKEYIDKSIEYFDQEVTDKVIIDYDKIIDEAKKINKKDFNKYYGNEEKTLIKRLIEYKENYLLWILRFDVPFSNNLSERSLRSSKTKMKVSGQFSNLQNAEYYARIKSYIETCKRNNINSYSALLRLFEDNPYTLKELKIS